MENSSPNPSFSICDIRIQKQMSRSFGKSFPQKIALPKLRPHCSATCPNTWMAEHQRKMSLSTFKKNFTPAKSRKQGTFFFGVAERSEAVAERYERTIQFQATTRSARAISRHQDYQQNTFELCLIHTAKISNQGFRPKNMVGAEVPSVHAFPQKSLIQKGFSTLRVARRLPIQFYE